LTLGYWHQRVYVRHGNSPQANQELLVVRGALVAQGALVAVWQSAGPAIGRLQVRISAGATSHWVYSAFHPSGVGK